MFILVLVVAEEQRALQQQEERAVDAEDFERAADLSARLDALNASVSRLADDLRAAEAECEFTSAFPLQICCESVVVSDHRYQSWPQNRVHEPD
jgi:excinuclease UvrABC nuclease subunit